MLRYFFYNSICKPFLSNSYVEANIASIKEKVELKGYDLYLLSSSLVAALPSEKGSIIGSIIEFKNQAEAEFISLMFEVVGFTEVEIEVEGQKCRFIYMTKENSSKHNPQKIHGNNFPEAFKYVGCNLQLTLEKNYPKSFTQRVARTYGGVRPGSSYGDLEYGPPPPSQFSGYSYSTARNTTDAGRPLPF